MRCRRFTEKDTPAKPKKTSNAAKVKKINKQLEGISKAEQMVSDLLSHGLGTLHGTSVKTYEALAKDLGSCYLTGAQTEFIRLANEVQKIQKSPDAANYDEALRILIRLSAMLQMRRWAAFGNSRNWKKSVASRKMRSLCSFPLMCA